MGRRRSDARRYPCCLFGRFLRCACACCLEADVTHSSSFALAQRTHSRCALSRASAVIRARLVIARMREAAGCLAIVCVRQACRAGTSSGCRRRRAGLRRLDLALQLHNLRRAAHAASAARQRTRRTDGTGRAKASEVQRCAGCDDSGHARRTSRCFSVCLLSSDFSCDASRSLRAPAHTRQRTHTLAAALTLNATHCSPAHARTQRTSHTHTHTHAAHARASRRGCTPAAWTRSRAPPPGLGG
jgi:hypothetical protein